MPDPFNSQNFGLKQPQPLPAFLQQALDDTGRTRFSSATPAPPSTPSPPILSPKPNKEFQQHLEAMNKLSFTKEDAGSVGGGSHSGSISQLGITQLSITQDPNRHSNSSSRNSDSHRSMGNVSGGAKLSREPSRNSVYDPLNVDPQNPNISRIIKEFHSRIESHLNKIRNSEGITPQMQAELVDQVQCIAHEFNQQHWRLQDTFNRVAQEKNQCNIDLEKAYDHLDATMNDRNRAYQERDDRQRKIEELQSRGDEDNVARYWRNAYEKLLEKIAIQDDQLKGKRALWLKSNPGSSARRDAMNAVHDPFSSPTASRSPFAKGMFTSGMTPTSSSFRDPFNSQAQIGPPPQFPTSMLHQVNSTSVQSGPPHHALRKRPNLPTQRASDTIYTPASNMSSYNNTPEPKTEVGSPTERDGPPLANIRADLAYMGDIELADHFSVEFAKIFSMAEGWAKSYSSQPNQANDRKIAQSSQELWQYMMNCTYPGSINDSHPHVIALLNDARSRFWFIMRMIIGCCFNDLLDLGVYKKFSPKHAEQIASVQDQLNTRGLNAEERQKLISEQAMVIADIIKNDPEAHWQNGLLAQCSTKLRDMLGPLLNDGCDRYQAGTDLGALAICVWNLSINIHTSHLTFLFSFPETGTKFNATTMVAKDQRMNPLELQIRQVRLKLIITPVVTLRDDRDLCIKAKALHNATVLIMQ